MIHAQSLHIFIIYQVLFRSLPSFHITLSNKSICGMLCACVKAQCRFVYSKEGITSLTLLRLLFSGLYYLSLLHKLKEIQGFVLDNINSSNLLQQPEIAGIQSLCSFSLLNCPCCMAEYRKEQGLCLLFPC